MPKGTKVEEVYRALRDEGMSKEKAAKIAQAQTGLALATGEPPKYENSSPKVEIGRYNDPSGAPHVRTPPFWWVKVDGDMVYKAPTKKEVEDYVKRRFGNSSHFTNGAEKATQEIQNYSPLGPASGPIDFIKGWKPEGEGISFDAAGWNMGDVVQSKPVKGRTMFKIFKIAGGRAFANTAFENGCAKAQEEIQNKLSCK